MTAGKDSSKNCVVVGKLTTEDFGGDGVEVDMGSHEPTVITLSNGDSDGWLIGTLAVRNRIRRLSVTLHLV